MFKYTTNPVRLWLAELRYSTGRFVEHRVDDKPELSKHPILKYVWRYGINTEGDYNCMIEPQLGEIIKWERKEMRHLKKARSSLPDKDKWRKHLELARFYGNKKDIASTERWADASKP
jgi:hypothetical protein